MSFRNALGMAALLPLAFLAMPGRAATFSTSNETLEVVSQVDPTSIKKICDGNVCENVPGCFAGVSSVCPGTLVAQSSGTLNRNGAQGYCIAEQRGTLRFIAYVDPATGMPLAKSSGGIAVSRFPVLRSPVLS